MDRRSRLIEIFRDTEAFYTSDEVLSEALGRSIRETVIYEEGKEIEIPSLPEKSGLVRVSGCRSFEAAVKAHSEFPSARIAVLNFASATTPGGGVLGGSGAQEECLCRCSTLYPCLAQDRIRAEYYDRNRKHGNNLHTDTVIYSPGVTVCKSDTAYPERLGEKDWTEVDVISYAAPNLRERFNNKFNTEYGERPEIDAEELYRIHLRRGEQIIRSAVANGADVLILGAFGCGAFRNDPAVVARAYGELLKRYGRCFDLVEFAVYHRNYETENYNAFKKEFA